MTSAKRIVFNETMKDVTWKRPITNGATNEINMTKVMKAIEGRLEGNLSREKKHS